MNLDDFLVPNSIASPAGLTPPLTDTSARGTIKSSALPIKTKKDAHHTTPVTLIPNSVPQPLPQSRRTGEFAYVQRRVRKTSVDEKRVSENDLSGHQGPLSLYALTRWIRQESALLSFHLKCLLQRCP